METILYQIVNGIVVGAIYALIAMGLNLIWSITDVPDFGQGGIYIIAAYVGFYAVTLLKLPFFIAVLVAMCVGGFIASLYEKFLYSHWRGEGRRQLLCAIALFFLMENIAVWVWTPKSKIFPTYLSGGISLIGIHISFQRIVVLVIATLAFVFIYLFMKTKFGKAVRASSQDKEIAQIMGINIDTVNSIVFTLGGALSALAAMMTAPLYTVYPTMGDLPLLKALVVVVLGGFGSVAGILVCGVGLGVIEALCTRYILSGYQHGYAFFILLLVLVFRPKGLFGKV